MPPDARFRFAASKPLIVCLQLRSLQLGCGVFPFRQRQLALFAGL